MIPWLALSVNWCVVVKMRRQVVASALEALAKALRESTSDDEWSVVSQSGEAASSGEAQPAVFVDQEGCSETVEPKSGLATEELKQVVEKKGNRKILRSLVPRIQKSLPLTLLIVWIVVPTWFWPIPKPPALWAIGRVRTLRHGESWSRHFEEALARSGARPRRVSGRKEAIYGTRPSRVVQCRTPMCSERGWWGRGVARGMKGGEIRQLDGGPILVPKGSLQHWLE